MNPNIGYAVIRAGSFALQALRRGDPSLAGRPLGLVREDGRRSVLAEVSAEAAGIEPGLPVELAAARCPGLVLRPRDPAMEVEAQRLLLAAAFALAPRVEATAAGRCTIDLQGADGRRLPGALRRQAAELAGLGLTVRIGAGGTPWVAELASRADHGQRQCSGPPSPAGRGLWRGDSSPGGGAAGDESAVFIVEDLEDFLAPLPLDWAEPTPVQAELLARWGLRTFGALTAIPKPDIGRRWGAEGIALWERAAGESVRVLRLVEPARTFAAEWSCEPPVESVEPLLFRLRRFAERIALELRAAGWVAGELALTLFLENGTEHRREFRLPEPGGDAEAWLRVMHSHLDGLRTEARVTGVRLLAVPARPELKQDGLFDTGLADPHAFWENLARLGAVVGSDRVGTPRPAGTHRPDAFALEKPAESVPPPEPPPIHPPRGATLRRFRPARPVRVALAGGRPVEVGEGPSTRAVRGARGPWRTSGGWWTPGPWSAETWQVELAGGGVYQLARVDDAWSLEGMFD